MAEASKISIDGTEYDLRDTSKAPNTVVSKTANGLCPRLPNETTTTKYLRQDGTWVVPPTNLKYTTKSVTTDANGNASLGVNYSGTHIMSASTSAINAMASTWIDSNGNYNVHVEGVYGSHSVVANTPMTIGYYYFN